MTSESSSSRIPDVQGRSNALAESIIGLYKTELIRTRGPWRQSPLARGLDGGEIATLESVAWSTPVGSSRRSAPSHRQSSKRAHYLTLTPSATLQAEPNLH